MKTLLRAKNAWEMTIREEKKYLRLKEMLKKIGKKGIM